MVIEREKTDKEICDQIIKYNSIQYNIKVPSILIVYKLVRCFFLFLVYKNINKKRKQEKWI